MSMKERCSRGAPCVFCGDVGYDMRVHYPENEEVVHWCHKTNAAKGDIVSAGGTNYICIASKKRIDIGEFDLFKEYLTKEEWMMKQERLNPDWKSTKKPNGYTQKNRSAVPVKNVLPAVSFSDEPLPGEEKVRSNKELDRIYRTFLSLLVLEDKHKHSLLKEWESSVYDVAGILKDYPIRSLPPVDKARYSNGESFKNPTRKAIISKLLSMFGDLRGVPGFYLRSGSYWDAQPEKDRWTFSPLEGMIFPCYDKDGYLYRIRIRDDYPDYIVKEGKSNPYLGMYGIFHHSYDKDGKHLYTFQEKGKSPVSVRKEDVYGRVNGKYKNFSSLHESMSDGTVVNTLKGGSRSGSPYSLYDKYSNNYTVMFGTEGEKKGMVANAVKKVPVVSVAGVSTFRILFEPGEDGKSFFDTMVEKGMRVFVLCYDADKEDKEEVKKAEAAFIAELKAHGISARIGYWKKDFDKGLDDILLAGIDVMIGPA